MTVETVLRDAGLSPWIDSRAAHRASDAPKRIEVVPVGSDDTTETITAAVGLGTVPLVLVMRSGGVLVLSQGGYGPVAVQGPLEEMTEEQAAALSSVTTALSAAYGIETSGAPRKRSRKKADPEEVVVEVITDDPEVLALTEEAGDE